MPTHTIHIGGEKTEYLDLSVSGRQFPDSLDDWDSNWLICDVEAVVGAFRASLRQTIRIEELQRFFSQLVPLQADLAGSANLELLDDWLALQVEGNGRGQMEVICRLSDFPGHGNTLEFHLHLDQTYMPSVIQQIEELLQAYPVASRKPA